MREQPKKVRKGDIKYKVQLNEEQKEAKHQMLALLTRLGKTGKIVINGDNEQQDTNEAVNGLKWAINLSKHIPAIKHVKLKENHRSGLVGEILDFEYSNKKVN